MGYYTGNTNNYKKVMVAGQEIWQHKHCLTKESKKANQPEDGSMTLQYEVILVKEFIQFGATYLICMGELCASSAEQVIAPASTSKRSGAMEGD